MNRQPELIAANLSGNDVHVWLCDLGAMDSGSLEQTLNQEERARG